MSSGLYRNLRFAFTLRHDSLQRYSTDCFLLGQNVLPFTLFQFEQNECHDFTAGHEGLQLKHEAICPRSQSETELNNQTEELAPVVRKTMTSTHQPKFIGDDDLTADRTILVCDAALGTLPYDEMEMTGFCNRVYRRRWFSHFVRRFFKRNNGLKKRRSPLVVRSEKEKATVMERYDDEFLNQKKVHRSFVVT